MATVTVSMPYHGQPDLIRRAVDAVLAQTHTDLQLIVVNDGDTQDPPWPMLADITDPRLTRFDLPTNRGRYYADAVTFAATDPVTSPWWTVHDHDDAAGPRWLETMLAAAADHQVDVVLTAQTVHGINGRPVLTPVKEWQGPVGDRLTHHAHMAGLWSVAWLRQVVGPHPGYRIGWDTIMTGLSFLAGRVAVLDTPLYDRHRRRGSLTISRETGTRSLARRAAMSRAAALWPRLVEVAGDGPGAVGAVIEADVPADLWVQVKTDMDALLAVMERHQTLAAVPARVSRRAVDLVTDDRLWTGWALDRGTAAELDARLAVLQPRLVVEAGSGASTAVLARYAAATGAKVVTLEHDPRFLQRTEALLDRHFPGGHRVDLRLAPLTDHTGVPWYDTVLPDGIDFALVDGPPEGAGGRAAALPALIPHLAEAWEVWLDDGARPGERAAVAAWEAAHDLHVEALPGPKQPLRITPGPVPRATVDATSVVVTVLTGARPHLLAQTLTSLRSSAPGLLDTAQVIVLRNGDDQGTRDVLAAHQDAIDAIVEVGPDLMPLGQATSLLAHAAHESGLAYWLHLEDDWTARTAHDGWLQEAMDILDSTPWVGQVRLRHHGETTLGYHMVTRETLRWALSGHALVARVAHWTCNPALVRTADIPRVWPAPTEVRAQRRAHVSGLRGIARMVPGVFNHIGGGGESLRLKTGSQ